VDLKLTNRDVLSVVNLNFVMLPLMKAICGQRLSANSRTAIMLAPIMMVTVIKCAPRIDASTDAIPNKMKKNAKLVANSSTASKRLITNPSPKAGQWPVSNSLATERVGRMTLNVMTCATVYMIADSIQNTAVLRTVSVMLIADLDSAWPCVILEMKSALVCVAAKPTVIVMITTVDIPVRAQKALFVLVTRSKLNVPWSAYVTSIANVTKAAKSHF